MKLLDRHISTELAGPFIFGVAAFTSLMFAGKDLFKITELLAERHVPLIDAVKLIVLNMPSIVVITLPMAMLLAALLGFGRLSGDSEVVAMFAGGVSLYRIAAPVTVLAIGATCLTFVLNEVIVPSSNAAHERLMQRMTGESMITDKPFFFTDATNGVTNAIVYVQGGGDVAKHAFYNVAVVGYNINKPVFFVYGKKAIWKGDKKPRDWSFQDGYWQNLGSDRGIIVPFEGSTTREIKLNKTPEQIALFQKNHDELNFMQLRRYIAMLQASGQDATVDRVALYQKLSLPLACLVFALIGTPLGLRPQRSSSAMGLGLSIVIIFAYWVLTHYMTILGENGQISPAAASFIPTLAGAGAGVALIVRAAK